MKVAFVLFDGMTTLDFIGFYDAVTRLRILQAELSWAFCSDKPQITDDKGLKLQMDEVLPDLSGYDVVFVPGGMATRQLRFDEAFVAWLQTAANAPYKVSVCTGALLLGAAGFLAGKTATTNSSAYDLLEPYCGQVSRERYVQDGHIFTGGGVSASIDLGLFFVERLYGSSAARQIQAMMDYPYYTAAIE
ncbi:DJ-1/PfpI family protein [Paenibacillus protaetiae]|uniref:DJ-1/PfpI family protein n=1 Tax=Paenibacillus protaetiae TaxID=2509456 RepID=A0A4P6EYW3_9BACL|nr:DJ-1/PfpI family protein [Paenibacillus protaetiae]QAY65877.1 DJ-1/PfpI family protein [Paenibacillus protaetiae]